MTIRRRARLDPGQVRDLRGKGGIALALAGVFIAVIPGAAVDAATLREMAKAVGVGSWSTSSR